MYQLQKQAKKMKKELENVHVFAEQGGVKVVVNAAQKVIDIEFLDDSVLERPKDLKKSLMEAFNRASEKAQTVSAEKMKHLMGGSIPGLGPSKP